MNEAQITMKSLADALGNSTRWEALRELAAGEPLLTIELSEQLGAVRNSLSRHMKILHSCGLVTKNRAGQYAIPPGCTLADVTNVASGVDAAITAYLFAHPDVNNFLTSLQGQDKDSVRAQANDYFQANPQVKAELDALRAPSVDLRNRCGIPAAAIILGVL